MYPSESNIPLAHSSIDTPNLPMPARKISAINQYSHTPIPPTLPVYTGSGVPEAPYCHPSITSITEAKKLITWLSLQIQTIDWELKFSEPLSLCITVVAHLYDIVTVFPCPNRQIWLFFIRTNRHTDHYTLLAHSTCTVITSLHRLPITSRSPYEKITRPPSPLPPPDIVAVSLLSHTCLFFSFFGANPTYLPV